MTKIKFKYLRRFPKFFHYWSIIFKKDYKCGDLRYHLFLLKLTIENNIDYWLADHFKSYHYQGLFGWLYNRYYVLIQAFTPFLKWSRWTFNQCLENSNKQLTDNTNSITFKATKKGTVYYDISVRFGLLKVIERKYLDKDNNSKNLFVYSVLKNLTDLSVEELKEVKKVVYRKFIFTKKQAISAIKSIKENVSLSWDSFYCNFDTYFIDKNLKKLDLDEFEYIIHEVERNQKVLNSKKLEDILQYLYRNKRINKLYQNKIIVKLKAVKQTYKKVGYFIKKEDCKIN